MTKKDIFIAIGVTIFWLLIFMVFNFTKENGEVHEGHQSEFSDSLLFDSNLENYDMSTNTILVHCDTILKYWENINTEEQTVMTEIKCDSIFLHCDTVQFHRENDVTGEYELLVTTTCDTLYIIEN